MLTRSPWIVPNPLSRPPSVSVSVSTMLFVPRTSPPRSRSSPAPLTRTGRSIMDWAVSDAGAISRTPSVTVMAADDLRTCTVSVVGAASDSVSSRNPTPMQAVSVGPGRAPLSQFNGSSRLTPSPPSRVPTHTTSNSTSQVTAPATPGTASRREVHSSSASSPPAVLGVRMASPSSTVTPRRAPYAHPAPTCRPRQRIVRDRRCAARVLLRTSSPSPDSHERPSSSRQRPLCVTGHVRCQALDQLRPVQE